MPEVPCKQVENFISDKNNLTCDCNICALEDTAELELIRRSLDIPDHRFVKQVREKLKMSEDDLQHLLLGDGLNALGRIESGLVPTPKIYMQMMRLLFVKPDLIEIIKEQQ